MTFEVDGIVAKTPDCGLSGYVEAARGKCYVLPVKAACNARCVFCATDEYKPQSSGEFANVGGLLAARVLQLEGAGVNTFEITGGGEPTLHPRLREVVTTCRRGDARVKLYTNGGKFRAVPLVDELNLSRCAFESDRNQTLMRIRPCSPAVEDVVEHCRRMGIARIRLSVPLVKGGVDTLAGALEFVQRASPLVDAIVLRPLYPATPDRDMWLPEQIDSGSWGNALASVALANDCTIEIDEDGCFRSKQLILANDLRLYSHWSLSHPLPW